MIKILDLEKQEAELWLPPPGKNSRVYMERFVLEKPIWVLFALRFHWEATFIWTDDWNMVGENLKVDFANVRG